MPDGVAAPQLLDSRFYFGECPTGYKTICFLSHYRILNNKLCAKIIIFEEYPSKIQRKFVPLQHDSAKETTFGTDPDGAKGCCRRSWYACFYSQADSSMALCETCQKHWWDDQSLEAEPCPFGWTVWSGHNGSHRLSSKQGRHHQIPLPGLLQWHRNLRDWALCGNGVYPGQGQGHALRLLSGWLQDELPVLSDGQAGMAR